jgi:hypothetical protein
VFELCANRNVKADRGRITSMLATCFADGTLIKVQG